MNFKITLDRIDTIAPTFVNCNRLAVRVEGSVNEERLFEALCHIWELVGDDALIDFMEREGFSVKRQLPTED